MVRSLRLLVPATALTTLTPMLGLLAPPADAADDPHPVITGQAELITAVTTPAPHARRAGKFTAYPVPTSAAGLGRITTGPDGSMWFVEEDKNRVGRITTKGQITEYVLPETTTGDGSVEDLDVDSSGRLWVAWDSGWKVSRFDPDDPQNGFTWSFAYPYAEEIRVGPKAVWVTMRYDEDGIVRIAGESAVWDANAPECDGALGRGRDGLMWCQQFDNLIRVNTAGTGGKTVPLPDDATYPYSIAKGPDRSIWFGRDGGGTMFTSPSRGNIGWVTAKGKVKIRRIGDRTAPRSLTTGKDGNVWFASVGAAKGVGHMNSRGEGAVVKVGNYRPTSVTYGGDGAIWFTDSRANAIVRVPRKQLWVTNLDLGAHSRLEPHRQPKATLKGSRLDADKSRKEATIRLACGKGRFPCQGKIQLKAGGKKVGTGTYAVPARSTKPITVRLGAAARKLLQKRAKVSASLTLKPAGGKKIVKKVSLTR